MGATFQSQMTMIVKCDNDHCKDKERETTEYRYIGRTIDECEQFAIDNGWTQFIKKDEWGISKTCYYCPMCSAESTT